MWIKHFGKDNVIVRIYEDAALDVVRDFCKTIGIDRNVSFESGRGDIDSKNPRLSARAIRILRWANENNLGSGEVDLLRRVLINTSSAIHSFPRGVKNDVFSDKFHHQVLPLYEKDTKKLVDLYPVTARYLRAGSEDENLTGPKKDEKPLWVEQVEILLECLLMQGRSESTVANRTNIQCQGLP